MHLKYKFKKKLVEGVIKSRPNRFVMIVDLDDSLIKCHCPSTGRIGNILFSDVPCLLSKTEDKTRKTEYTVEAISLDPANKKEKMWIGINQVKANVYIEFFLKNNLLQKMVKVKNIKKEIKLRNSRIDFLVDNTYIEVKTPLIQLPSKKNMKKVMHGPFTSFDRLIKHFKALSENLPKNSRAILLMCYMYDAKPFSVPKFDGHNIKILAAAKTATKKGIKHWQINLKINPAGISIIRYFKLDLFGSM
jgi:sugar fermentation stimulation protein A